MDVTTALIPWLAPVVTAAAPHMLRLGENPLKKLLKKSPTFTPLMPLPKFSHTK